jgi:hypothetical protein
MLLYGWFGLVNQAVPSPVVRKMRFEHSNGKERLSRVALKQSALVMKRLYAIEGALVPLQGCQYVGPFKVGAPAKLVIREQTPFPIV